MHHQINIWAKKYTLSREHLGPLFLCGYAEWMNCRHLTARIVDSRFWISYGTLNFSHVRIGKPYVCSVFRPRATWVGVVTCTCTWRSLPNLLKTGSLLSSYGFPRHYSQFTSVAHGKACFSMCNTAKLRIMLMEHCKASLGLRSNIVMLSRQFFPA